MIRAPWLAAKMMAAAIALGSEVTSEGPALTATGRILASGATPTIPVPYPCPAISAAIMVPWPAPSVLKSCPPLVWWPVKSPPGRTAPRRSGTLACTPVSITATVTPAPWVTGHESVGIFQVVIHHSSERGISLTVAGTPAPVLGDEHALGIAIGNLLDNALKYTGQAGNIRVTTAVEGPDAVCRVADDGPGIAAEHLGLVFEPFYRPDDSRSRETGGTPYVMLAWAKQWSNATGSRASTKLSSGNSAANRIAAASFGG